MGSIRTIVGLDERAAEQLAVAGIRTTEQLLEAGATSASRLNLADRTQVDVSQIDQWIHQADLSRVKGVSPELAFLLCEIGVLTVPKLAYRRASELYEELVGGNQRHVTAIQLPGIEQLREYIASAKCLPKLVRH